MEYSYALELLWDGSWNPTVAPDGSGQSRSLRLADVMFRESVIEWPYLSHRLVKLENGKPVAVMARYEPIMNREEV